MELKQEIERRRTFAIISHPDAGKTTLTEKLLLFGGAIHVAGAVKSNKIKRGATSDFMEIERQRGISVATSVMGFEYGDVKINILDTPGHEDFAEDTYRTLTAVDSVIIVIDGAKGVETQTRKLMEVCRMRNTPVMVFVNKLDRPCKDPFDLLDEIERELKIQVRPLAWPISTGPTFKGVYDLYADRLSLFFAEDRQTARRTDARHKARRPGDRRVHQSVHAAPARRPGARRRRLSSVRPRQLPQGRGRAGLFRQRAEQFRSPRAARLLRPYRAVARQVAYAPARRVAL